MVYSVINFETKDLPLN